MGDDIKFSDMRVGDTVQFESLPAVAAPMEGIVVLLNATMMTYESGGKKTALRRASLRLERRVRAKEGHFHWLFE